MGDVIVLCPERLRELEKRIGISTSHCTILVERINYLEVILFGKEQKTNPLMPLATRLFAIWNSNLLGDSTLMITWRTMTMVQ